MPAHNSIDSIDGNDGHCEVAAADRDITAFVINQTHDQELSGLTYQSPFINPWPAAEPRKEEDVVALVPWWKALPVQTQLSTAQTDLTSEVPSSKPTGAKGTPPTRTANSHSNLTTLDKRGWSHSDFVGGSFRESPNAREEKKVKMMQSDNVLKSSKSIGNTMECFPASDLYSNYISFDRTFENMENRARGDYLSTPVGACVSVGGVLELARWRGNLCGDSQIHIDRGNLDLDWNPSPISLGESATSMGVQTNAHYPTQLGDTDLMKAATIKELADHHDRDSSTDDNAEPECEFNLKAIRKSVKDVMKLLKEMQQEEESLASKNRQVSPTTAMIYSRKVLLTCSL